MQVVLEDGGFTGAVQYRTLYLYCTGDPVVGARWVVGNRENEFLQKATCLATGKDRSLSP